MRLDSGAGGGIIIIAVFFVRSSGGIHGLMKARMTPCHVLVVPQLHYIVLRQGGRAAEVHEKRHNGWIPSSFGNDGKVTNGRHLGYVLCMRWSVE